MHASLIRSLCCREHGLTKVRFLVYEAKEMDSHDGDGVGVWNIFKGFSRLLDLTND